MGRPWLKQRPQSCRGYVAGQTLSPWSSRGVSDEFLVRHSGGRRRSPVNACIRFAGFRGPAMRRGKAGSPGFQLVIIGLDRQSVIPCHGTRCLSGCAQGSMAYNWKPIFRFRDQVNGKVPDWLIRVQCRGENNS